MTEVWPIPGAAARKCTGPPPHRRPRPSSCSESALVVHLGFAPGRAERPKGGARDLLLGEVGRRPAAPESLPSPIDEESTSRPNPAHPPERSPFSVKARDEPAITEAFERLYRAHRGEIYRRLLRETGNREEAEDLAQKSFLNALTALNRGTRPEQPRAWLHAISRNVRRRRYRTPAPTQVELDPETPLPVHEEAPTVGELKAALERLTPNQRESFLLFELGGLNYVEIADRLDVSPAAVESLLVRARRTLRTALGRPSRGILGLPAWLSRLLVAGSDRTELLVKSAAVAGAAAAGVAVIATPSAVSSASGAHRHAVPALPAVAGHATGRFVTAGRLQRGDVPAPIRTRSQKAAALPKHRTRVVDRPASIAAVVRSLPTREAVIEPESVADADPPRTHSEPGAAPTSKPREASKSARITTTQIVSTPVHQSAETTRQALDAVVTAVRKVHSVIPAVPDVPVPSTATLPTSAVPNAPSATTPPAPELPAAPALTQAVNAAASIPGLPPAQPG